MKGTLRYILQQAVWLLATGATLVASMGVGVKWVFMTFRCMMFAMLDLAFFLPNVVWYIFSPNIIRGVSYRSSQRTKIKNLEMLVYEQQRRDASPDQSRDDAGAASGSSPLAGDASVGGSGRLDLDSMERLAATINLADGSFVNGLPVNVAEDMSHLASNNSFDAAIATLQKLYQRRSEQQERNKRKEEDARAATAAPADVARSAEGDKGEPYVTDSFTESDDDDEDEEDKKNLHNRAKLDIYLPVPLDSLFRFMSQEKRNADEARVAADARKAPHGAARRRGGGSSAAPRLQRKKFPVIISVNGGAWIVGYSFWNFLIARIMAARGYVVFCPDYRNFPQTTMEGMTLDVSDAIAWVLNNAERYNGDLNDVTLMGQSAGAHLTMMSLISQAHLCAYEAARVLLQDGMGVPPPSDAAYNVPRYNPRKSIRTYVGLSGIYNIRGLVKHFDKRGLYRKVLYQIAGGKQQMPRYSVLAYFDDHLKHLTGEYLPDNFFDYMPRQMSFIHGDADKSAPVTESANLVYVMRNAQRDALVRAYQSPNLSDHPTSPPSVIEFILVPGATHTDSIIEEPLCCRNSHAVEFLTLYPRADEERRVLRSESGHACSSTSASGGGGGTVNGDFPPVHGRAASLQLGATHMGVGAGSEASSLKAPAEDPMSPKSCDDDAEHPVVPVRRPDGILLSPMPLKQRSRLLRLASYICPF